MNLPLGVYVVSSAFEQKQGNVSFEFKDNIYTAQMGINAFKTLEDFLLIDAKKAEETFFGYKDITVLIMPKGEYLIGLAPEREQKTRTRFPWPVAILGENAGVSPNAENLRTPTMRREESKITGTFYMGCLSLAEGVEGALIIDGLTLDCKVYDERTSGKNAGLIIKNCIMGARTPYAYVLVPESSLNDRYTCISDCRVVGVSSIGGEGNVFCVCAGSLTVDKLFVAETDKFLGMSDYALLKQNKIASAKITNSLFENSQSINGLVFNLPKNSNV